MNDPATEYYGLEGNEPDLSPATAWDCTKQLGVNYGSWQNWLLQRGQHVNDVVKAANPFMPIVGPALTNYLNMCKYPDEAAQGADTTCHGVGDFLASLVDIRNVHDYPSWYPLATQYGNNGHVRCPAGAQATCYLKFEDLAGNTGMISGEYGYSDQVGTANYTPDAVMAKYLLRAFELKQNEGYSHLYDFQLCPGSTNFAGMRLRSTCSVGVADLVLPQFTAFQSYVAHFGDSGTPALTPIDYNLTSSVSTVQFGKLSQFSDGRYSVVAWNEVASSAHGTGALISVPLAPTKLVLPSQYTPNGATATTQNADGSFSTNPVSFTQNADGSSELDYGAPDSLVIVEFYIGPHPSPAPTTSPSPVPTASPTPQPSATPTSNGAIPLHVPDYGYYEGLHQNERIPAAWMAAHFTFTEQGSDYSFGSRFVAAGGQYALFYTDTTLVPYCNYPAPYGCRGPIGSAAGMTARESAWQHDSNGKRLVVGGCTGSSCQEVLNPADALTRASYAALADGFTGNAMFVDDTGGSIDPTPPGFNDYDLYKYGALSQEYCAGMSPAQCEVMNPKYIADTAGLIESGNKPVCFNGGAGPENLLLLAASPKIMCSVVEGAMTNAISYAEFTRIESYLMHVAAIHKYAVSLDYPNGSEPAARAFDLAAYWLTYDGTYSVLWSTQPVSSGDTGILPEEGIVLDFPLTTGSSVIAYQASSGVFVREFGACALNGQAFGKCAAIVNTTGSSVALPALRQSYVQSEDFTDTTSWYDGGTTRWTTIPGSVAAHSAVILRS